MGGRLLIVRNVLKAWALLIGTCAVLGRRLHALVGELTGSEVGTDQKGVLAIVPPLPPGLAAPTPPDLAVLAENEIAWLGHAASLMQLSRARA